MAIEVDGKTYRNLPEQVEENANNIQWLLETIQSFGNVMRYCGSVATYDDLPTEDNRIGDVWNVLDTGNNYAWDGEAWDEISSIVDLSGYVTKINCPLPYINANLADNVQSTFQANGVTQKIPFILKLGNISTYLAIFETVGGSYRFRLLDLINFTSTTYSYWTYPATFSDIFSNGTTKPIVTTSDLASYTRKWSGTYVGDETSFVPTMHVGDIIKESTGGQFLINEITFSGSTLTKVVLVGLEDNGNPVVHTFENGAWSSSNYISSNFVDLISAQTISGKKTLNSGSPYTTLDFMNNTNSDYYELRKRQTYFDLCLNANILTTWSNSNITFFKTIIPSGSYNLGSSDNKWNNLYLSGDIDFGGVVKLSGTARYQFTAWNILPYGNQTLGNSSYKFGGLYLTDTATITDGTNSVTVADLANLIAYAKAQGWIS